VRIVEYWASKGPFVSFTEYALDLIERNGLDDAHTARALALVSVAQADAVISVWDAKYTWWTSRPITEDPDLDMLLPTPAYPSYPSGFSAVAGSAAVVLSHLFPRAEIDLMASAARRPRNGAGPASTTRSTMTSPWKWAFRSDAWSTRSPAMMGLSNEGHSPAPDPGRSGERCKSSEAARRVPGDWCRLPSRSVMARRRHDAHLTEHP
jgi:hypothetical protein